MAKKDNSVVKELNYEQAFAELETVVAALEGGETSLEEAMKLFERGQILSKHCAALLNTAELKVEELSKDDEVSE